MENSKNESKKGISKAILAVVAVIIIAVAAAAVYYMSTPSTTTPAQTGPTKLSIGTGAIGGTMYYKDGVLSIVINKYVNGVTVVPEATAGGIQIIQLVDQGLAELGSATSITAALAWNGTSPWFNQTYRNLRGIFVCEINYFHLVTLKSSDINSIYDLAGKTVDIGPPGSASQMIAQIVLQELGLWNKVNVVGLRQADIADALKEGRIQASIVGGSGVPVQWIVDLSQVRDIKIISLPDDAISKITSKYPFFLRGEIPANSYKGVNYTVTTLTQPSVYFVNKNLPEGLVYNITKAVMEHKDELLTPKGPYTYLSAFDGMPIPLHPGAYKYYKEKGLQIPSYIVPS
ncbi:MAG: TAXI family TRAP transporter solute-binding subunit [Candidatus Methanomethyliaceae archaeon]